MISWLSGNAVVSGVGGLRLKSWAGQSNTVLPMAHHHSDISSKGVVLLKCNDVEMGPANSFNASTYYSKYHEKFDVIPFMMSSRVAAFRFFC